MLQKQRAPAEMASATGTQTQKTIGQSIAQTTDTGNQATPIQVLDAAYLAELLRAFDNLHGLHFEDPGYPLRPVAHPLWRRSQAEIAHHVALAVLHSDHVPGFVYDLILPSAERYQFGFIK